MIEFWAVATRPLESNGLALSISETIQELAQLKQFLSLKADIPEIYAEWENLVARHQVIGKKVHDARLVAAMIIHKIDHLLTFNTADFKRFSKITVVDPRGFF